jgi:hypothetical protein
VRTVTGRTLVVLAALLAAGCSELAAGNGDDGPQMVGSGVDPDAGDDDDSSACNTITSSGPSGKLVAFEVASTGSQWLLTHAPDSELTTVWENRGTGWTERLLDGGCRRGVLAIDRLGRANVACAVGNPTLPDYDVRLFVFNATTITSRLVQGAQPEYAYTKGGFPVSIVFDANGLANVLWQATYRGTIHIDTAAYYLSRDLGSSWSTRLLLQYSFDGHTRNDRVRLVMLGSELHLVFRDNSFVELVIARVTQSGYERIATFRTPTNLATGFAFDYELMKSPDNKVHLAIADETNYGDVTAPGLVYYFPDSVNDPTYAVDVDGVAPFGDGQAGLGGISMAFDSSGVPRISYAQKHTRSLRISWRGPNATDWERLDLVPGTSVGDSALRFDAAGHAHIAYEDIARGEIEFLDEVCMP